MSRLLRYFRATPLPNTGSVARDLLAAERTFLSWCRTGLGFIALGVALEKVEAFAAISPTLLHLQDSRTKVAAGVLVASGSVCVAHGTQRYFDTMRLLNVGKFRPNAGGVTFMAMMSIGIALVGAFAVVENEQKEKRQEKEEEEHPHSGCGRTGANTSASTDFIAVAEGAKGHKT